MFRRWTFLFLIYVSIPFLANANSIDTLPKFETLIQGLNVELSARAGRVLVSNDFLAATAAADGQPPETRALSMTFTKRVSGSHDWHRLYNYPSVGVGISKLTFDSPGLIGSPIAVFGIFDADPVHLTPRLRAGYSMEAGMAFGWNSFDPLENPLNLSIGAEQSAHFRLAASLSYALSQNLALKLDGGLGHWSNGALRKPNKGINNADAAITLRYTAGTGDVTKRNLDRPVPALDLPTGEFTLGYFYGLKYLRLDSTGVAGPALPNYFGFRYPMMGLQAAYQHRLGPIGKLGVTVSIDYDAAVRASAVYEIEPDALPGEEEGDYERVYANWQRGLGVSIAPSYTLVLGKTEVLVQVGGYVLRSKYKQTPAIYQRVGIRHYVWKDAFVGASLRAYGGAISEVIEWNAGWRLRYLSNKESNNF